MYRDPYYYATGHYYNQYRPIYYSGYAYYYPPWPYYSYVSVYQYDPVVYRPYGYNTVYIERSYEVDSGYGVADVYYDAAGQGQPGSFESTHGVAPPADAAISTYDDITQERLRPLLEEAGEAFAAGRYEDARNLYIRAMLADERDGYAKLLYGMSSFALGEYEVASVAVRRALLTTELLIDQPLDLRTLYAEPLLFERQLDELIRRVQQNKDDQAAKFLLGYLNYSIGRVEAAVAMFTELSTIDPADTLALKLRNKAKLARPLASPGQ